MERKCPFCGRPLGKDGICYYCTFNNKGSSKKETLVLSITLGVLLFFFIVLYFLPSFGFVSSYLVENNQVFLDGLEKHKVLIKIIIGEIILFGTFILYKMKM